MEEEDHRINVSFPGIRFWKKKMEKKKPLGARERIARACVSRAHAYD